MTPVCSLSARACTHARIRMRFCALRVGLGTAACIFQSSLPRRRRSSSSPAVHTRRREQTRTDPHGPLRRVQRRAGANKWEAASNTSGKQCLVKLNCRERRRRRRRKGRENVAVAATPFGTAAGKSFPTEQSRRRHFFSSFFFLSFFIATPRRRVYRLLDSAHLSVLRERGNLAARRERRRE